MRFLFCSFESTGFLYPMVGLALELRGRGHQVAFASGLTTRELLDRVGIERVPRGTREGESFRLRNWGLPVNTAIDVKHAEHAVERFAPDALVTHQLCQAPLLVRERQKVPVGVVGMFSYLWPPAVASIPAIFSEEVEAIRRWRLDDTIRIFNGARELFRMPAVLPSPVDLPLLGDLFMLRTVPELEPELGCLPPQVHAVGPCLWEPGVDEDATWATFRSEFAEPDAPVLYVQQGRTFGGASFWRQLVDDLADCPVQVVAATGRMDEDPGPVPPNFLVRDYVPQGLVLRHARAVVCGGHTSAVLATLSHGLPSVVVPTGGETPDVAEKLVRAGCALSIPADGLTAGALRAAVGEVLDGSALLDGCRRARRALARAASFGPAARLVERLGATGASVDRGFQLREAPAAVVA